MNSPLSDVSDIAISPNSYLSFCELSAYQCEELAAPGG